MTYDWEELPLSLWEFSQTIASAIDDDVHILRVQSTIDADIHPIRVVVPSFPVGYSSGVLDEKFEIELLIGPLARKVPIDSRLILNRTPEVLGLCGPCRAYVENVAYSLSDLTYEDCTLTITGTLHSQTEV